MRAWSIILGVVIFLCVVSVSFAHTVDLYKRVGFLHWEATIFTIAVETTFLLSGWSILWCRNRGQKPSGSAYAGFLYGIVLVLFSNSAYTVGLNTLFENNIAQWGLALSVVLGVLIAESIISQNLINRSANQSARQVAELANQPTSQPISQPVGQDQPANHLADQPHSQVAESANHQPGGQSDWPANNAADQPANKMADQSTAINRPATKNNVVDMADRRANRPAAKKTASDQPATDQESATSQPTTNQSVTGRPTTGADPEVVEVVEKYYKENGELPSQRKAAEMADCSRYQAAKAIDAVKEKYNIAV